MQTRTSNQDGVIIGFEEPSIRSFAERPSELAINFQPLRNNVDHSRAARPLVTSLAEMSNCIKHFEQLKEWVPFSQPCLITHLFHLSLSKQKLSSFHANI